jgi:hypothetical protein
MSPIEMIAAERERQQAYHEWTTEHDDRHDTSELARAAACYCLPPGYDDAGMWRTRLWPWEKGAFHSGDRVRELVKAGALIVAEIERLQRLEASMMGHAE